MRLDVLSIPIAITTFVSSPEPISISKTIGKKYQLIENEGKAEEFSYFSPIKTSPLVDIRNKIQSFKVLSENWDGMGGIVPNLRTINNSLRFINSLPESTYYSLNKDNVIATSYGTIVLDLEVDQNIVSVELGESKIGFFTDFTDGDNLPALEGVTFNQNVLPIELLSALNKLFSLQEAEA